MKNCLVAFRFLLFFTFLCGGAYPLLVTLVAQALFPEESGGGILQGAKAPRGAMLLAQEFKRAGYFWPRPSSIGYNPLPSGATNLGPTSKALRDRLATDRARGITGEMLYVSASGLDPEISPAEAITQALRVAKARGASPESVNALVRKHARGPQLGIFGEARVNVLELNLALEGTLRE